MGAWGAVIMGFFGAVFAASTLYWQLHLTGALLALPFVVFALIGMAAVYVIRQPGDGIIVSARAGRAIMWSSIGEGVGLFIAGNLAANLHRPDLVLPAMALVVGLHFLPIAYAVPFTPFYGLGAALIVAAVVGFGVSAPSGGEIAGGMAAFGLWLAAIFAVRRDLRTKQAR